MEESESLLSRLAGILAYDPAAPMLFNTGLFFVLFALFMCVYLTVKNRPKAKMLLVIAFSLYFYYKSSAWCCLILAGVCVSDFYLGLWMARSMYRDERRLIVWLNVLINVGMLVYFKYFNLLADAFTSIVGTSFDPVEVLLPAGISFFSFRSISYIVDLYRDRMEPCRSLLEYAFFLTFFPPLLAGPVVRARDMLPQIQANSNPTRQMTGEGLFLVMTGLLKKVVIADYLSGNFVDRVFDNPALYSGFENLMGCIAFTIQLYCDFSGYSDMAIGIALMLGYRFADNFKAPFKAQNPQDFWRRWHISLSTWLRDYVYIPLGGNRHGKARAYLNQMLTMIVGGLWHGASWMYLLWGAYHGALLVIHKMLRAVWRVPAALKGTMLLRLANTSITFALVVAGFAIFRAPSLETLEAMATQIFTGFHAAVAPQFVAAYAVIVVTMAVGLVMHLSPRRWSDDASALYVDLSVYWQAVLLAAIIFLVVQTRQSEIVPFIYLQY